MVSRSKWWRVGLLGFLCFALPACAWRGAIVSSPTETLQAPSPTSTADFVHPTERLTPTATATDKPDAPATPTATATPVLATGPRLDAARVHTYPVPAAAGDMISFDIEPVLIPGHDAPYTVTVALPDGVLLSSPVLPSGFDRNLRARFVWAWDTTGLDGTQQFTVTLLTPSDERDVMLSDNVLTLALALEDPGTLLPPEPDTQWESVTSSDIRLHYLVGSAAERDLPLLTTAAQNAYADVAARFGVTLTAALDIYVLDRVIGQGGYATTDWVAISYTDRAYAPSEIALLLRHELTHRLDGAWGCDDMPSLFREGLAVMIAGGHYWPESLPLKAAALLETGEFIPLDTLVEDFYRQQHEIGYLEAGALLSYLVEERGWESVASMCAAAKGGAGDDRARFDHALAAVDMPTLPRLEQEWLRWLRSMRLYATNRDLLESEWALMDTLRLYQVRYDRAANYLTGILFDPEAGVRRGIAADFVRKPRDAEAVAAELVLQASWEALRSGDHSQVELLLASLMRALEEIPDVVMDETEALVVAVRERGYEPYRTVCVGDGTDVGQRAPGCIVFALDLSNWPEGCLLWATRAEGDGAWTVVGPQIED